MDTFRKVAYTITGVLTAGTLFGLGYWRGLSDQNDTVAACERREEIERRIRLDLEDMLTQAYQVINTDQARYARCRENLILDELYDPGWGGH